MGLRPIGKVIDANTVNACTSFVSLDLFPCLLQVNGVKYIVIAIVAYRVRSLRAVECKVPRQLLRPV